MKPEQLAEYGQMRSEILARAILHQQQGMWAVVMQLVCILFLVWLNQAAFNWEATQLFLLLAPVIFAGLAFNYQANQCTMQTVAKYLDKQYGSIGLEWERFFAKEKAKNKLVSFSKALPMIWPLFVPVAIWLAMGWPAGKLDSALMIVDLVLLVMMLLNFRYKLQR